MAKKPKHSKAKKATIKRPRAVQAANNRKRAAVPVAEIVPEADPPESSSRFSEGHFPIVGVGASAGGLEAFTRLLKSLRVDTGMGFVLVQHMDPSHESVLASLLQKSTKMPIQEASDGTTVEPNRIYICPPNAVMTISKGVLALATRGTRSFKDFPIDQFFVSLADDLKNRAIGVVLSGTASDGTRGLLAIKAEGGITFAQDSASAQFSSMPASAVASGCVDFTLPPGEIATELARINGHPYLKRARAPEPVPRREAGEEGMARIIRLLRAGTGVDFSQYKPAMVARRIARRMALHKLESMEQYHEFLRKNRVELNALQEDIFIHVTGFFRDPESLIGLQRRVLANLIPSGASSPSIRIWVPGCSTGEEVYSIGILLFEQLGERRTEATIQIFGTDISEKAVQRARAGIYPASSMLDVSTDRQRRFFTRSDGSYQITKSLRDVCIFARHDLSKDPPFSKMDVISCRNVLIYMGTALQKRVIEAFHYALKPGGHLLLGKSESLSAYSSLFAVEDNKHKILVRRPLAGRLQVPVAPPERVLAEKAPTVAAQTAAATDLRREAERILLDQFAPAALVVDAGLQIVHFQGNTGSFLSPASGEPSFHLLRMVRPELLVDVRTAIYQARKEGGAVRKDGIRFQHNGESSLVDIHVSPLKWRQGRDFDYLVVFKESRPEKPQPAGKGKESRISLREKSVLASKERELSSLREQLQAMVQDHEATDEEMRSMNEEILSSNEELQSTNEELETAKEELESSNEELTTLNDELQKRNSDLSQTTDDLSNLLIAVNIPIVILDAEMRIRRFTPAAGRVLNLIGTDLARPLSDIAPTLRSVNWGDLISEIMATGQPLELEVQDRQEHWFSVRIRPYRSAADKIDGIIIALLDIDAVKRSADEVRAVRQRSEELEAQMALIGEGVGIGVWEFDLQTGETRGSKRWSAMYGVPTGGTLSRVEWLSRVHPDDHDALLGDLNQLLRGGKSINREYRIVLPGAPMRWVNRRAELVHDQDGNPVKIHGVSIDVTERKLAEQEKQSFALRIASAQGTERQRIARELHDGLIQDLGALAVDLGRRAANVPAPSDDGKRDYKELQGRVIKAAEAARHIAYELHPSELDDLGLEKALRSYSEEFGAQRGIKIDFSARNWPKQMKREIASTFYKVAQEALWNVAKHSRAKRAKVALEATQDLMRLRVDDNGEGFLVSALKGSKGLGIASMRERIQLLNGNFSITSTPGAGTQVAAEVPLAVTEVDS